MNRVGIAIGLMSAAFLASCGPSCRRAGDGALPPTPTPAAQPARPSDLQEPASRPTAEHAPATRQVVASAPEADSRRPAEGWQSGWLRIEQLDDNVEGGWATGDVDAGRNKIIIETHAVHEFAIDLQDIRVNWSRRVLLQVNRHVVELTPKRDPLVRFRQTPTGEWRVVSE